MTVAKALPAELIDSLMSGYQKPEDLIGEYGLLKQITKAVIERVLQAGRKSTSVMPSMIPSPTPQATPATARAARRSRANSANCPSTSPEIAWAASSRS